MKNKFIHFLIFSIISIFLSSCDLKGLLDYFNNNNNDDISESELSFGSSNTDDTISNSIPNDDKPVDHTKSLNILEEVFNGTKNNYAKDLYRNYDNTFEEFEGTKRLDISKNATSLEYNDGIIPNVKQINGLVIPIEFSDYPAPANFVNVNNKVYYHSVASYYYNSSYGKVNMNFDILPWQKANNKSTYYERYKGPHTGEVPGVSALIKEIFSKLDSSIDFSKYDQNKDGYIDALYFVYSRPYNEINTDFWWAYQYCYFEENYFDNVSPYYYVFASFDFIFQYDRNVVSADTFIHETGHLFGINDYYDYDTNGGYNKGSLGGADMMDCNVGDHNPFSKMSLGWINNPLLITLNRDSSTTINLQKFSKTGDVAMICDNYDEESGIFQDYFLIIYFDHDNYINSNSSIYSKSGIKVYRIHGELEKYDYDGYIFDYFRYDNSFTEFNLIDSIVANPSTKSIDSNYGIYTNSEYFDICASNDDLFLAGYVCENLCYYDYKYSSNNVYSIYNFRVNSFNNDYASITFSV